jgi:hypothetical protein
VRQLAEEHDDSPQAVVGTSFDDVEVLEQRGAIGSRDAPGVAGEAVMRMHTACDRHSRAREAIAESCDALGDRSAPLIATGRIDEFGVFREGASEVPGTLVGVRLIPGRVVGGEHLVDHGGSVCPADHSPACVLTAQRSTPSRVATSIARASKGHCQASGLKARTSWVRASRPSLPQQQRPQPGAPTLAAPLQRAQAAQLTRRPTTDQPRSQPLRAGQLTKRCWAAGPRPSAAPTRRRFTCSPAP